MSAVANLRCNITDIKVTKQILHILADPESIRTKKKFLPGFPQNTSPPFLCGLPPMSPSVYKEHGILWNCQETPITILKVPRMLLSNVIHIIQSQLDTGPKLV